MSSASGETSKKPKPNKPKTNEEIVLGFQKLRSDQRLLTNKLNEFELSLHEHKTVFDTLKELDENRKCFRMIGGILCERTVKDVLPVLKTNTENLVKVVETLNQQLIAKGIEINKYKDEYNVRFKHVDEFSQINENETALSNNGATSSGSGDGGVSRVLIA